MLLWKAVVFDKKKNFFGYIGIKLDINSLSEYQIMHHPVVVWWLYLKLSFTRQTRFVHRLRYTAHACPKATLKNWTWPLRLIFLSASHGMITGSLFTILNWKVMETTKLEQNCKITFGFRRWCLATVSMK